MNSSETYKLMTYFAVATLYFYRADIIDINPDETLGVFAERNKTVIDRVRAEALKYFKYELSHNQIGTAIEAYLCCPTRIDPTEGIL